MTKTNSNTAFESSWTFLPNTVLRFWWPILWFAETNKKADKPFFANNFFEFDAA